MNLEYEQQRKFTDNFLSLQKMLHKNLKINGMKPSSFQIRRG